MRNKIFGADAGNGVHNFTPFLAQTQENIERNYGVKHKKESLHPQKYWEPLRGSNYLQNGHLLRSSSSEIGVTANIEIEAT